MLEYQNCADRNDEKLLATFSSNIFPTRVIYHSQTSKYLSLKNYQSNGNFITVLIRNIFFRT